MRVRTETEGVVQRGLGLVPMPLLWTTTPAHADVPTGPPVFTHPLDVPQVGVVQARSKGELLELIGSTLQDR